MGLESNNKQKLNIKYFYPNLQNIETENKKTKIFQFLFSEFSIATQGIKK